MSFNGESQGNLLLPVYVLSETLRALVAFAVIDAGVRISPTLITLWSEFLKLLIATVFLFLHVFNKHGSVSPANLLTAVNSITSSGISKTSWKAYAAFALPSALYLTNNILYLLGLQLTTPALLHVAVLAKLPFTALLHHFLIRPQRDRRTWLSLLMLFVGLFCTNLPAAVASLPWLNQAIDMGPFPQASGALTGLLMGISIAIISAFTSTYTEMVLKHDMSFWVAQFWLYGFGTTFAALTNLFWDGTIPNSTLEPASSPLATEPVPLTNMIGTIAVIVLTAATGLVVANILRKKDNLVKLVGTAAGIIVITIAQCLLFPDLREKTLTASSVFGIGIIAISTWTYHFYKEQSLSAQYSLDDFESGSSLASSSGSSTGSDSDTEEWVPELKHKRKSATLAPSPKRIVFAMAFVTVLAIITELQFPQHVFPGSGHGRNGLEKTPETDGNSTFDPPHRSLLDASPKGVDDVSRFFTPHNVSPAKWGQTAESGQTNDSYDPYCISKWVDRERVFPISTKFTDWEYTFLESQCPVYPIPRGGVFFHQFWSGKWRPFNEVNIEAWLATQRLGDGHRLIYWYQNEKVPTSVLKKFAPYADYVEFREFNGTKEAEGTCVASMPEWNSEAYRRANVMKVQSLSDITRNLLLSKYGGVWLDSDTLPMRDLTPLIRSGPSAGGISNGDWNNNLLILGPPNTAVTRQVLKTTCSLSINSTVYHERYGPNAPTPREWYWMWNDALLKICASTTHCGLSRIPIYFNDGWTWLGRGQRSMRPCQSNQHWFGGGESLPATLRTLWTWHPRLGQYEDSCVDRNGKTIIGAVRRRVDELLSHGLEMNGRDLFPGPVVTS